MHTLRIQVNKSIYKQLMWFLSRFKKDELQIIEEDQEYLSVRQYIQKELTRVEEGSAKYITLDDLEKELQSTINKYEAKDY